MSITDELREYIHREMWDLPKWKDELRPIADRIDATYEADVNTAYKLANALSADELAERGWVKLPVDADGVPIRVGDVVRTELLYSGMSKPLVVDRMELSRGRDGDLWCVALDTDKECWNQPSLLRHYHPPTVEDILTEFHERMDELGTTDQCVGSDRADAVDALLRERAKLIAEYAAKLRIAGEDE